MCMKTGVPELLSSEIYLFFHCIIFGVALAISYIGGKREKPNFLHIYLFHMAAD